MVKSPYLADPKMDLATAIDLMHECDIRHLPVVADEILVGLISEGDLKEAQALPSAKSLLVSDVMKTSVYVAAKDSSLREVIEHMADLKFGSAVVVNNKREVVGIFTTIDAMRILVNLLDEDNTEKALSFEEYFATWGQPFPRSASSI
jgi:acetoin utilization protein AcuB